ncbi:hypothetical protein C8F01DRAFT_462713 [Mycena amicta]|nr:hypothetical protein C8F01DRAFT_462713 [Mycena amicta]
MTTVARPTKTFSSQHLASASTQLDDILSILRTNASLSFPTAAQLRSVVDSAPADLQRYDTEITAAADDDLERDRLLQERRSLEELQKLCSGVFAPIRRLAPEILLLIFSLLPNLPRGTYNLAGRSVRDTVAKQDIRVAAAVCLQWHRLVMGAPTLWSTFTVAETARAQQANEGQQISVQHLAQCLRLSEPSLLRFSVLCTGGESLSLLKLLEHSLRWKVAHLELDTSDMAALLPLKGHLPELVTVSLSIWNTSSLRPLDILEDAPKLTRVSFVDHPPKLRWSQLLAVVCTIHPRFRMRNLDLVGVFQFLRRCSSQCSVEISGIPGDAFPEPETANVILSDIHSLRLGLEDFDSVEWLAPEDQRGLRTLLESLNLPNLRYFHLSLSGMYPVGPVELIPWSQPAFASFAARSPRLTTLLLYNVRITPEELISALAETPMLKRLFAEDICPHGQEMYSYVPLASSQGVPSSQCYKRTSSPAEPLSKPRTEVQPRADRRVDHIVLTNSFLGHLATNRALVPYLSHLSFATFLQDIDGEILIDCLRARIDPLAGSRFDLEFTILANHSIGIKDGAEHIRGKEQILRDLLAGLVDEGGLRLTFISRRELDLMRGQL